MLSFSAKVLSLALLLNLPVLAVPPGDHADKKFVSTVEEAHRLLSQGQFYFAIEAFRRANKLAGGNDPECLSQIYDTQIRIGAFKEAASTARYMQDHATTPIQKSYAESELGKALLRQADQSGHSDLLNAADLAFQSAIADNPRNASAHYVYGHLLARTGQLDAARQQFEACVQSISHDDPSYGRAERFAQNPALSLKQGAPAFTITALDGARINLDDLNGRVVLIDFWASWCPPCSKELPNLKRIVDEFADQPFTLISVSWETDKAAWQSYVSKYGMTWPQYYDADRSLGNAFGVDILPTYVVIDSDGEVTHQIHGYGSNLEAILRKNLAKAIADRSATASASRPPS